MSTDKLPGCFGCLGDIGPLALLVLILIGLAVQRSDAAAPIHSDDAVPAPLQICAPIAPSGGAPDIPPVQDIA